MHSVDTNVVVRYLTRDDPAQSEAARVLLDRERLFIGLTVLLETEWVLRDAYDYRPSEIVAGLRFLLGLPNLVVEEPAAVAAALDWTAAGLDFADAIHLTRSGACDALVTFDRKFAKRAASLAAVPVALLES